MCTLTKYSRLKPALIGFLHQQVPRTGLKTMFRDIPLKHVAENVVKLAKVCMCACFLFVVYL